MERIIKEADESLKYQFPKSERRQKVEEFIQEVCREENINIAAPGGKTLPGLAALGEM